MNLYLFPTLPGDSNGYLIAVMRDIAKCDISDDDMVIFYSNKRDKNHKNYYYVKRHRLLSLTRVKNVLKGRMSAEVPTAVIKELVKGKKIDKIICGEVTFYNALRDIYPDKYIEVRFHNCFARIRDRVKALQIPIHVLRFRMNMNALYKLETKIFRDNNCFKHFITQEDMQYYQMITGKQSDCDVWDIMPQIKENQNVVTYKAIDKLVWFGGVETHKIDSVKWMAEEVFPKLKKRFPHLEFHLWGRGTQMFNNPKVSVFGHGFYDGDEFPDVESSLFVNPDLMGGGIKVKLCTYFENKVKFITSPFGFEGYDKSLIDNNLSYCVEESLWIEKISEIINKSNNKIDAKD